MRQSPRMSSPSPMRLQRSTMPAFNPNLIFSNQVGSVQVNPPSNNTNALLNMNNINGSENIQVMIRVRKNPINESQRGTDPVVVEGNSIRIQYSNELKSPTYSFDSVATQDHDNLHLFKSVGIPVANYCLTGFNACIFAYGQTGAGKTHTMTGSASDAGLQPRVLEYLFDSLEKKVENGELLEYRLSVSYYEIYNEQINDLINNRKDIRIRENFEGPFIENLTILPVTTFQEAQLHFQNATKNRTIGATLMNKQSSRSHSIFTVTINMLTQHAESTSKLNFVDMAGSERQKKTQSEGQRLKEAGSINKSLFEFSKVIAELAKQKQQIVFRNSKLTHILKDCLIGNSRTWVICAISPSAFYLDETENTLKFASNAKFIETRPMLNYSVKVDVEELQERVRTAEIALEIATKDLKHKDSLLEQLQIHSETQDEQIRSMQQYYDSSIADIEAEKDTIIHRFEEELKDLQVHAIKLQKNLQESESRAHELNQRSDQQEIQLEEHRNRIMKLLEEKQALILENARQLLASHSHIPNQSSTSSAQQQQVSTIDSTPTPQSDGCFSEQISKNLSAHQEQQLQSNKDELNETVVRLEVELSILRNQNVYNKAIQKELEALNSSLSNRNMEMHFNSSNLLREKESLILEMNRINQSIGQKSQTLSTEIDSFKEQISKLNGQLESQRGTITELENALIGMQQNEQVLLAQIQEMTGENTQTEEKDQRVQAYLQQIHTLVSELKKREEQVKSIELEQIQSRKHTQAIQQISMSIISDINQNEQKPSNDNSALQEISFHEYQNHLKKVLLQKCEQLNSISSAIMTTMHQNSPLTPIKQYNRNQSLSPMRLQAQPCTNPSTPVKSQEKKPKKRSFSQSQQQTPQQGTKQQQQQSLQQFTSAQKQMQSHSQPKLQHTLKLQQQLQQQQQLTPVRRNQIQEQLEIFFIENPDFYINKKRLEAFDKFIRFVFQVLCSATCPTSAISAATAVRVRQLIDQGNLEMLQTQFKDMFTNDRAKLTKKYETLKTLLFTLSTHSGSGPSGRQQRIPSAEEHAKYSEYVDIYAEQSQPQSIHALLFEDHNQNQLRKPKRSPMKKQVLSDRLNIEANLMMTNANTPNASFSASKRNTQSANKRDDIQMYNRLIYEQSPVVRKKQKLNDY